MPRCPLTGVGLVVDQPSEATLVKVLLFELLDLNVGEKFARLGVGTMHSQKDGWRIVTAQNT